MVTELQTRNELNELRIWIRGDNKKMKKSSIVIHASDTPQWPVVSLKYFKQAKSEVKIWIRGILENEGKQSCHSCMQHSAVICYIILQNDIKIL